MSELCVYCAGGAGANIASKLMRYAKKQESGFSRIKPVIIDTSKSNINAVIPAESIYLVNGLDGSGKKRDSNYTALSECSKEILHQHKPADINIVLHSASGGKRVI